MDWVVKFKLPLTSNYVLNTKVRPPIIYLSCFSLILHGPFTILLRIIFYFSSTIMIFSTLSRQEDLESSYALCKFLGLTNFPILCLFLGFVNITSGSDFSGTLPLLLLLLLIIVAIFIILTNDEMRSYSAGKIVAIFVTLKQLFCCRPNENHVV